MSIFLAYVAKYIIVVPRETIVVKKTTKLSSFNGCYQNWMTYLQFSSTFSTKIILVVIIIESATTTLINYYYNQICNSSDM